MKFSGPLPARLRRPLLILMLALTMMGLSAAAAAGVLRFGTVGDVDNLDPHTAGAVSTWLVLENVYERLLMLDEQQHLQPWLAESYDVSDDGLTFTFHLRQGVQFHNGREMTADDVKSSFDRIMDPDVPAVAKASFSTVESVNVLDTYTVELVLKRNLASILYALARLETAIVPIEEVEAQGGRLTQPVGTGPFEVTEVLTGQRIVLTKNENYWREGIPKLDAVHYIPVPDDDVRLVNLLTGELDVIQGVPAADADGLESRGDVTLVGQIGTNWTHLSMNTQRAPFDDVRVRQAVRLAIDRGEILDLIRWGRGLEAVTPLPPSNPFSVEVDGWDTDLDRAKALLAEAGHADGLDVTLRAIRGINIEIAEVIQAQLARIGINLTIQVDEQPTWFSEVFNQRDYQMSVVAHVSKVDPDLSFYDILYTDEAKNYTRYSNPELDALLTAGRMTTDFDERKAIYDQVQEILASQSGYVVLFVDELLFGVSNDVQDFTLLPTGDVRWWTTDLNR